MTPLRPVHTPDDATTDPQAHTADPSPSSKGPGARARAAPPKRAWPAPKAERPPNPRPKTQDPQTQDPRPKDPKTQGPTPKTQNPRPNTQDPPRPKAHQTQDPRPPEGVVSWGNYYTTTLRFASLRPPFLLFPLSSDFVLVFCPCLASLLLSPCFRLTTSLILVLFVVCSVSVLLLLSSRVSCFPVVV